MNDAVAVRKEITSRVGRNQLGYSIPEIGMGVLVAVTIAGFALFGVPRIYDNYYAGKMVEALNVGIAEAQTAYNKRSSYAGISAAQFARQGWLDENYIEKDASGVPTGNLLTGWGALTFAVDGSNPLRAVGTMNNLPKIVCNRVLGGMVSSTYATVTVNGSSVKSNPSQLLNIDTAGQQCSGSTENTITFTFARS
jgi:hypothetical protein